MFLSCFFFPSSSLFITALSVLNVLSLANGCYSEITGKNSRYSKFLNINSQKSASEQDGVVSSKPGMLVLYAPAFLASLASFWLFPDEGFRFLLLKSALTFHFFKRLFEVLFIHKYSGGMALDLMIIGSVVYLVTAATMMYSQHLLQGLPEPAIDLKYPGIFLFWLGVSGNFYHHYLLSKMRKDGEKQYKIPKGGLFDKVVCPHYLFEIIEFWGITFISQHLYAFSFALHTTFVLIGRSYATRRWYLSKFDNFPKDVKALIPYIM